jgi:hypothetical protein
MAWLRIDDKFGQHPKVLALSDREFRIHITTLCYCAEYGTDGVIPKSAFRQLSITNRIVSRFFSLELWEEINGELRIHDFRKFNPIDPTSAERKARFRQGNTLQQERNGNAQGTDEEQERNGPRGRAHAPVPVPSLTDNPSTHPPVVQYEAGRPADDYIDREAEERERIRRVDELCGYDQEITPIGDDTRDLLTRLEAAAQLGDNARKDEQ